MNLLRNSLRNASLLVCALVGAGAVSAQQSGQVVCFSFDGTSNLTGQDHRGGPSRTGVRVGKRSFFFGKAGDTPAQCADALALALGNAGYTVQKVGANVVCVSAGPGGVALETGGIIGTTDTGLAGIDCEVQKPPVMPGKMPPKKTLKVQGVQVPQPKPGGQAVNPGVLRMHFDVWRVVNGQPVLVQVQVTVQINPGMTSQQIARAMEDAIRRAGLIPQQVMHQSPVLQAPIPSYAIDYDAQGNPVQHVVLFPPAAGALFPHEVGAGLLPEFGGSSYGENSGVCLPGTFHGLDGAPVLGGDYMPFVTGADPFGTGILAVGFLPLELPLLGGDLLIDPQNMLVLPSLPLGPGGDAGLSLPIPPQPSLAGLELHSQWLLVSPRRDVCLTNGVRTTLR